MYWWSDHMYGWAWVPMTLGLLVLLALGIAGGVLLASYRRNTGRTARRDAARPSPADILAERYARGEIDDQEYLRRLDVLDV